MKRLLLLFLLAACFVGCKKGDNSTPEAWKKKYKVRINVKNTSDFVISNASTLKANAAAPAIASAKVIYYYVFNSTNGSVITSVAQDSSDANFGNAEVALSPGNYTIAICAGQKGLTVTSFNRFTYGDEVMWKDTFYKKFPITVTEQVNQEVALDRIVAKLTINIADAIPANAHHFSVLSTDFDNMTFDGIKTGSSFIWAIGNQIPPSAIGTTDFKIGTVMIMNTFDPFDVHITCYDSANKIIKQKTVEDVMCYKNKTTVLSGNLFTTTPPTTTTGFDLQFNFTWDSVPFQTVTF